MTEVSIKHLKMIVPKNNLLITIENLRSENLKIANYMEWAGDIYTIIKIVQV